ncbi:hypothetical protein AB6735_23115 [Mucilaginibacter sp. RCC_168]|uniref:hypothetical protein n=1 Tax=Mucilaginibacter sp. RCC_168 TaxID=3239221 RepID=UPI003524D4D4
MIKVYLDTQYPKNLAEGLVLLHQMQIPEEIKIIRTSDFEDADANSVVFLFDRTKKGIDIITERHYEEGYKVFAFKSRLVAKVDIFQLSLSVLSLWPKILHTIHSEASPFVFTYKYSGNTLKKIK